MKSKMSVRSTHIIIPTPRYVWTYEHKLPCVCSGYKTTVLGIRSGGGMRDSPIPVQMIKWKLWKFNKQYLLFSGNTSPDTYAFLMMIQMVYVPGWYVDGTAWSHARERLPNMRFSLWIMMGKVWINLPVQAIHFESLSLGWSVQWIIIY